MKCYNCKCNKMNEKFYLYSHEIYCIQCLREYFVDELMETYFENFLDIECKEVEMPTIKQN